MPVTVTSKYYGIHFYHRFISDAIKMIQSTNNIIKDLNNDELLALTEVTKTAFTKLKKMFANITMLMYPASKATTILVDLLNHAIDTAQLICKILITKKYIVLS
jgi:hypothetical protein